MYRTKPDGCPAIRCNTTGCVPRMSGEHYNKTDETPQRVTESPHQIGDHPEFLTACRRGHVASEAWCEHWERGA